MIKIKIKCYLLLLIGQLLVFNIHRDVLFILDVVFYLLHFASHILIVRLMRFCIVGTSLKSRGHALCRVDSGCYEKGPAIVTGPG